MIKRSSRSTRPVVLFVGAFPAPSKGIVGGNVTDCRILLDSDLADRLQLVPFDTTKPDNDHAGVLVRTLRAIARAPRFVIQFHRAQPDAVILFVAAGLSVLEKGLMIWYSKFWGVPSVVFPRGGAVVDQAARSGLYRLVVRMSLGRASAFACQGPSLARFAVDILGADEASVFVIENWTASPSVISIGERRTTKPFEKPMRVVFVGWLIEEKGPMRLIQVVSRLPSGLVSVELVGDGPLRDPIAELVRLDEALEVVAHGWYSMSGVEQALAKSDVFVLPSLYEGFPNALVEAMAAGLACVVTDVGAIAETVGPDSGVIVLPPGRDDLLERTLLDLASDPSRVRRNGRLAHDFARRHFTIDSAVEAIEEVVRRVAR